MILVNYEAVNPLFADAMTLGDADADTSFITYSSKNSLPTSITGTNSFGKPDHKTSPVEVILLLGYFSAYTPVLSCYCFFTYKLYNTTMVTSVAMVFSGLDTIWLQPCLHIAAAGGKLKVRPTGVLANGIVSPASKDITVLADMAAGTANGKSKIYGRATVKVAAHFLLL